MKDKHAAYDWLRTPIARYTMDLDAVIKQMEANEQGHTKSAAVADNSVMAAAVEKAASAPSPVADTDAVQALLKTANELAGAEKEAEISHAAICGQAFADGAIAKFAAYDAQALQAGVDPNTMQKVSADHEGQIKAAAEYGYNLAFEKMAEDYDTGHNEALHEVHDVAASEFIKGAAETAIILEHLSKQAR